MHTWRVGRLLGVLALVATYLLVGGAGPASALTTPAISSIASPTVSVGLQIFDNVQLSGGANPTGSLTFNLFGPDNATCAGSAIFTSTVPVSSGNGSYTSAHFTTAQAGTYQWVASYSGDGNNNPAGPTSCSDPSESVIVSKFSAALTTIASPGVPVGGTIHDTATLGGFNPTGTITFRLSGPSNMFCSSAPVFTATVPVTAGSGNYPSPNYTPTTPGTYRWQAIYSGDANNSNPAGPTACLDPAESVVVSAAAPQIAVTKAASPLSRPEPGGAFTFTVQVTNPSAVDPVKITSLVDNIYGDLATRPGSTCGALIGAILAPGAAAPCSFTGPFTGLGGDSQTDTVTVTGVDANGNTVTATAQATVTLTVIAPSISVAKTASPLSRVEPGGTFTFTVTVTNSNPVDPVKITKLIDNIYGDLSTRAGSTCGALIGVTLAPAATSQPCSFTGPFTGVAGASQTDTVTATAIDSHGTTVTAAAQATVSLTATTPMISVTKTATPLSRPAPGGTFTFTVQVTNPSATDPVKITSLSDNIYGDLASRAGSTCGALIGVTLAPGASPAPCSFTGPFTGSAGDSQTDTVTVTGVDTFGHTVTAAGSATVTLTEAAPTITTSASTAAGGTISDAATLSGGLNPTGIISFKVFGPNNATCTGLPVFTSFLTVTGNGVYSSAPFLPGAGSYNFVVSYSGDNNNLPAVSGCGSPNETVTVACTRTITGNHVGSLVLGPGLTCIVHAHISGSIVVTRGASVDVESSTVSGSIVAAGASSVRICGTSAASVVISRSTGFVLVGGDGDDGCAANTVRGSLVLTSNSAGVEAIGNHVVGAVVTSRNSGSGPLPEDTAPDITGNGH